MYVYLPSAASSDVNGRVIPAVMGIGRPDAAQVAAIALAKIPWIVQVITGITTMIHHHYNTRTLYVYLMS